MDSSEFRVAAQQVIEDITEYYDTVASRPKVLPSVNPGYLRSILPAAAPEDPDSWQAIHADIKQVIMPGITHWQSPSFHAFFPCSTSYPAMLGELYSNAFNGVYFNWVCSPAATELETIVLDWLARLLSLPDCFLSTSPTRGGGVIQGSVSETILVCMAAARDKFLRSATAHLPEGSTEREDETWRLRANLVALGSERAHSCSKKAAQILGIRYVTVPAPAETGYSMTGPALASVLADLRARGLEPFYLTTTLGTTDICAVDDFPGIRDVIASDDRDRLWVHVDAAYAGTALMLPEYAALAAPLDAFHSITVSPHKWMLTSFDCVAHWVRDRAWLIESLSIEPAYLRNQFSEGGLVTDYRNWQISLGRRFRSLKLWFVLRAHGALGLRAHLRHGIDLGEAFAAMLRARPDLFEILTKPLFALIVFACKGATGREESNRVTKAVLDAINDDGVIYLTPTRLNDTYGIRMSAAGSRDLDTVKKAFDIIVAKTEKALAARHK